MKQELPTLPEHLSSPLPLMYGFIPIYPTLKIDGTGTNKSGINEIKSNQEQRTLNQNLGCVTGE